MKPKAKSIMAWRYSGLFFLFWLLLLASCGKSSPQNDKKPSLRILASTTMIQAIVSEVGGEVVDVVAIVPAGMCPGHFDIKPKQVAMIAEADLVMLHGWEKWLETLPTASRTKINPAPIVGNWLIPEIHIEATKWVEDVLIRSDAANSHIYRTNSAHYQSLVSQAALEIKQQFGPYQGIEVIASDLQAEFLTWLGLKVVATYGRAEDLTPAIIADLTDIGRKHNVGIVVDNLQSGSRVGDVIAKEISAQHVVLSNFPQDDGYIATLKENANRLEDAIKRQIASYN